MMREILGSRARVKLLTLFLLSPGERFYVRELARKTGENINSVRRELQRLERVGLLMSEREGNLNYYKVNQEAPIYEDLKRIFLKTEGIGRTIKDDLAKLGEIKTAFIYGSFAKGEERLGSDIDMIIVGEVEEEKLIGLVRRIEGRIGRQINYVLFTPAEFKNRKRKKDPFLTNVLKEPKIELVGTLDEDK